MTPKALCPDCGNRVVTGRLSPDGTNRMLLNPEPVANGPWRTDGKGVVVQDSSAGGLGFRAHACPKRSGTP